MTTVCQNVLLILLGKVFLFFSFFLNLRNASNGLFLMAMFSFPSSFIHVLSLWHLPRNSLKTGAIPSGEHSNNLRTNSILTELPLPGPNITPQYFLWKDFLILIQMHFSNVDMKTCSWRLMILGVLPLVLKVRGFYLLSLRRGIVVCWTHLTPVTMNCSSGFQVFRWGE